MILCPVDVITLLPFCNKRVDIGMQEKQLYSELYLVYGVGCMLCFSNFYSHFSKVFLLPEEAVIYLSLCYTGCSDFNNSWIKLL